LTLVLDLIHVLEYLWRAAWALHREGDPQAERWVSARLLELLRGHASRLRLAPLQLPLRLHRLHLPSRCA
jgi:hypothetical protein